MAISEPYVKLKEQIRSYPAAIDSDGVTNIGGVVVSPKGKSYQYISGPNDFLEKLVGADELPRNSHISLINAYYCSYFAGLVIARALNTEEVDAVYIDLTKDSTSYSHVKLIGDSILTASKTLTFDLPKDDSDNLEAFGLLLNGTLFYYGSEAIYNQKLVTNIPGASSAVAVAVESLNDIVNSINSWSGFSAQLTGDSDNQILIKFSTVGIDSEYVNDILSLSETSFYAVNNTTGEEDTEAVAPTLSELAGPDGTGSVIALPSSYMMFKAVDPSGSNNITLTFNKVSNKVYKFGISIDGETEYYQVSPYADQLDESGNNCYIENLNAQLESISIDIVIAEGDTSAQLRLDNLDLSVKGLSSVSFGNSGFDITASQDPKYFSKAIYRLAEQKEFQIAYLSDFGVTSSTYINDYVYVGANNYWFTPVDIPYNLTSESAIEMYGNGVKATLGTEGMAASNVLIAGPFDKNSSFLGWITKIAWSSLFYERVFTNKANNSEYAPCFEQTNGVLNYTNPYKLLGDTDRTKLLNASSGPINYVKYDQANKTYYLNDNRTHQTTNNVMSEEQNRRMINQINRDVKRIMSRFKGKTNTSSTRSNVESLITIYFDNNLMNQEYAPVEYQVVCDESNNTNEVITANKLALTIRVRLLGAIKFIDVVNDIYPLGVDFES